MRLLQNEKTESLIANILIFKSLLGSEFRAPLFSMSKSKSDTRAMSIWQNPSTIRISSEPFYVKGLKRSCRNCREMQEPNHLYVKF